jgi:hypothetical protein
MTKSGILAGLLLLAVAAPAAGQAWDTPSFLAPRPADDLGVFGFLPEGSDWGFGALWRQSGNVNLGVRAAVAGRSDARVYLLGAELSAPLPILAATPGAPLAVAWTAGLGASLNGVTMLTVPVGISAGATFRLGAADVTPYVHPRLAFDLRSYTVAGEETTDTEFSVPVDIGAEAGLGETLVLRVGYTIATANAIGVGIAIRTPRRVAVR